MSDKVAEIPQLVSNKIAAAESMTFNRKPSLTSDYQQGAYFGYSLAQQEIVSLHKQLQDSLLLYQNQVATIETKDKEIERLEEELKTEIGYKNMHRRFRDAIDSDDE